MVIRKSSCSFTVLLFSVIFLFAISSCDSKEWNATPKSSFAEKLALILNPDSIETKERIPDKKKGKRVKRNKRVDVDVIAGIWLHRVFNSLGSPSFMVNYNQFKKRADLINKSSYNFNVHELIYYHYVTLGEVDSSRVYLDKAFDYFIANGKEKAAYTLPAYYLLMLVKQNQTKTALDACQHYLSLAKNSGSAENVGRCYELSATIYKEIQMYSLAIPAYEKYVEIAKQTVPPETNIYNDINALAEINLFIGNYDKMNEALSLFDSLMTNERSKDHLKGTIAVWNALKASCFLDKNHKDSAQVYLTTMREMYSSNLISNHLNYETEIRYSEHIGDYKQALAYSDTLLRFYQQDADSRHIGNAQLIQARLNKKLRNYKKASEDYAAYILSKDSLDTADLQKQAIAMQASKEVADAQLAEGVVKQKLAENKNVTLWVFIVGLLLVGALLIFLLIYYIRNQYQLKEYNSKLRIALHRAEEGVRMKENFMHHISHEIRTPLNSIIGFSSVLEEMYPKDKKMHQYLGIINENGQKLIDVITGILNVSNLQNTMIEESFTKQDISKLVTDIIDKYRSKATANTEIQYQSSLPKNFKIAIRLESLSMLLEGIISNAVKYTTSGLILVKNELDESNTFLILTIEDTGIGINEDDADKIFNLFFKENKYELGGGTGLFVSQQVAEGHRGTLIYDKDYKGGARFILKLPLELV